MLVSILIPCYNAERWVGEAIESALDQTWPEKEVIVINDGSTDGSLEVIKRYGDRIRWESGPNRGGNAARNRLLELAQGEWLQYLDADDYLLPLKLERQIKALTSLPKCDVIYSPVFWVRWSEEKVAEEITPVPEPRDPAILLARWWLPQTGGPLWRKDSVMRAGGWDPGQPCCQEHELYLRLLMKGARFEYFDECHAAYRDWHNGNGVSKGNVKQVLHWRLQIELRLEQFLREHGQLTEGRLHAINQARFEIARQMWLQDRSVALRIIELIEKSHNQFMPVAPAAPVLYRAAYSLFGFERAEKLAGLKRSIVSNL